MKSIVLGFAGKRGSGKSTLTRAMAKCLNCSYASFGDYIRGEADRLNVSQDVENLQRIGGELIKDPLTLLLNVLKTTTWESGDPIVFDGIRHVVMIDNILQTVKPDHFYLIYIDTDEIAILDRLRKRGETEQQISEYDIHSTEQDVKNLLRERANLIVNSKNGLDYNIQLIKDLLHIPLDK